MPEPERERRELETAAANPAVLHVVVTGGVCQVGHGALLLSEELVEPSVLMPPARADARPKLFEKSSVQSAVREKLSANAGV
ncbi:hypothetical protein GCM10009563_25690 [Subtercola frigoramans]